MVRQVRARQTRSALITAAAGEFARLGYAGATVAKISTAAGVTSGALTFHFLSKDELARAVADAGVEAARAAVGEVERIADPGLAAAERLTQVLAALLEQDVHARATVRLMDECPDECASWEEAWRPALDHAMERARAGGADDAVVADVRLLIAYLLAGTGARMRAGRSVDTVRQELARLWQRFAEGLPV
ncbi:TetR/AcrR family transcriptional regulator [Streptomyces roseicoloratus]|uniref:TetR family transcriptional regulator n=1 Tax=Streptomyces roseicoloratus TaxID=2508722 RepID=A0ABY9RU33_9ACTN|nr:TetR/AcrR family transcriptional regulator [Streptomyces roseicoloratus]WMX45696.1 TetR family transcriptional regulator [Streptomyces roseicoloratus]